VQSQHKESILPDKNFKFVNMIFFQICTHLIRIYITMVEVALPSSLVDSSATLPNSFAHSASLNNIYLQ
jgi:hypothetical protein